MLPRLDILLADLTVLGTLAWRVARSLSGDRFGPLAMANAWSDWLETAGLAAAGHSLFHRKRFLAGLALLAVGAVRAWQASQWRLPHDEPLAPADLRVFTQNLLWPHRSGDGFTQLIQREQPDVLMLQELTPVIAGHILAELGNDYPHRFLEPAEGSFGFGLLSHSPLSGGEILRWPGGRRYVQIATTVVAGCEVDLYNCHLLPPLGKHLNRLGASRVTRLREAQIRLLTERILATERPAIMAGDFNLTPSQQAYDLLTPPLIDAWSEAGRGPGVTWPLNMLPLPWHTIPLLRLDYCFHTPDFVARRTRVLYSRTGSDHCPLVVDLAFAQPQVLATDGDEVSRLPTGRPALISRQPSGAD
ncbi:MAG: endonuclease/exonuclease/phosphatase family protein [Ardenticatenaceae bacterium]|nr:endonuclease/exonuclease/phosphatase family protein [Ardenticatenaceae bacterium]HBY98614.1 hypothetical protein [Chloroflexota bacterium]